MSKTLTVALERAGFSLIETHISRVYLRGADVYKTKRAVALGFLDFTTLAARHAMCEAEVRLNARLAPEVYLGVVAIVQGADGELTFVPASELAGHSVLEWAVHMRRLSERDRADVLLAQGALEADAMREVAALLAGFHRGARSDHDISRHGARAAISENVEENFTQVAPTIASYLAEDERTRLMRFQRSFLAQNEALFAARVEGGYVRDGHGDLRLEHLYRTPPDGHFVAIDCIEFNDRFRYADVCADLAFLAMDLEYHGRPELASVLLGSYAATSGDYGLYALIDFYQSYRATVRAKVSSMLASDDDVSAAARERALVEARRYYLLALAAACGPLPTTRLIITFGLIASGKSTVARALGDRLGAAVLSADVTRKELLGIEPHTPQHDAAFTGAYAADVTERVYATLLSRAELVLRSGRSALLDATFSTQAQRAEALALGARLGVEVLFVECRCPPELTRERLARRAMGPSISDGRADIYDAFVARYERPSELEAGAHLVVDTSLPLDSNLAGVLAALL